MSSFAPDAKPSVQRQMLRGSLWTMGYRWAMRLTGLVSTVILARLLTPADYGIVAIAMLIVGTIETFSNTGQYSAIIRHPNPTREHYDSVWTVSFLLGLALTVISLSAIPLTTVYFHEPAAAPVVAVLALRTALLGFQNVGVVDFQRDLRFSRQFQLNVYSTWLSFAATLGSAFILRSYWALVIGIMTRQVAIVMLSYAMHPYRPAISFAKAGEIWSFSIWTLVKSIGLYAHTQVDKLAIGSFAGAAAIGRYDVAQDVSSAPSQELVAPMAAVLFPVLSTVQQDASARRRLYLDVLYVTALVCASVGVGVALVGNDLVDVVLGPQWGDVKPLVPWLSLSYCLLSLGSTVYPAFETIGMPMVAARLQWMRVLVLALAVFPVAFMLHDLEMVAAARFAATAVLMPTLFVALGRVLDVPFKEFALTLWRPFTAGVVMAAGVLTWHALTTFPVVIRLPLDVSLGATLFIATVMLLWRLAGSPPGPEKHLLGQLLRLGQGALWRRRPL